MGLIFCPFNKFLIFLETTETIFYGTSSNEVNIKICNKMKYPIYKICINVQDL